MSPEVMAPGNQMVPESQSANKDDAAGMGWVCGFQNLVTDLYV